MDCCKMSISIIEVVTFVWCPLSLLTGWLIMELSGWHCGKSERGNNLKIMTTFLSELLFHTENFFKRINTIDIEQKTSRSSTAAVNVCGCIWVEGEIQFYIHLRQDAWWNILFSRIFFPCYPHVRYHSRIDILRRACLRTGEFQVWEITIILLLTWLFSLNFQTLAVARCSQ